MVVHVEDELSPARLVSLVELVAEPAGRRA